MAAPKPPVDNPARDLIATAIVAAGYFAYLLFCADLPAIFGRAVGPSTLAPWGMVGGVLVVLLVIGAAIAYMVAHRGDPEDGQ